MRERAIGIVLFALLAACDDATVITHVFRLPDTSVRDLAMMQRDGGVPVEIHGLPFAGATRAAVAAATEPPARAADVRFRASPVAGPAMHGARMVLHFNPTGAPNGPADCARDSEAMTDRPGDKGFTVMMTVCRGAEREAQGFLQAPAVAAGDYDAYGRAMRQLFLAVFRDENDR